MTSPLISVADLLSYRPCRDYPEARILELWAGRPSLSPREIGDLDIPAPDRIWALCNVLARHDRPALVAFVRRCADADAASAAACAAYTYAAAYAAAVDETWELLSSADAAAYAADAAAYAADAAAATYAAYAAYAAARKEQIGWLVEAFA